MNPLFVWGAGGVGKTHMAIRMAALAEGPVLLITLDPSQRIFDLLGVPRDQCEARVKLLNREIVLKRADQNRLFEALEAKKPAHPTVKAFYQQMVKGLQDFRDYLTLIQLSDDLREAKFKTIIIDTPPFQEAMGLHRSLFNLRHFFEKSLVQFALKSSSMSWVHGGLKRLFDVVRIFSGKKAAQQVFDFIEWLTSHTERFSLSAKYLEDLVFSKKTRHLFTITPETPERFLESVESFFSEASSLEFAINRSVSHWKVPKTEDLFLKEFIEQKVLEDAIAGKIKKTFPKAPVQRIPLLLMGDDTPEELNRFITS